MLVKQNNKRSEPERRKTSTDLLFKAYLKPKFYSSISSVHLIINSYLFRFL